MTLRFRTASTQLVVAETRLRTHFAAVTIFGARVFAPRNSPAFPRRETFGHPGRLRSCARVWTRGFSTALPDRRISSSWSTALFAFFSPSFLAA